MSRNKRIQFLAIAAGALALAAAAQVQPIAQQEAARDAGTEQGPTNRTATAAAVVKDGAISMILVTDGGRGYIGRPAITIADSTGSNAVAVAHVIAGSVVSITISAPGRHYSAPSVTVAPPPQPADPVSAEGGTNAVGTATDTSPAEIAPVEPAR